MANPYRRFVETSSSRLGHSIHSQTSVPQESYLNDKESSSSLYRPFPQVNSFSGTHTKDGFNHQQGQAWNTGDLESNSSENHSNSSTWRSFSDHAQFNDPGSGNQKIFENRRFDSNSLNPSLGLDQQGFFEERSSVNNTDRPLAGNPWRKPDRFLETEYVGSETGSSFQENIDSNSDNPGKWNILDGQSKMHPVSAQAWRAQTAIAQSSSSNHRFGECQHSDISGS